MLGMEFKAEFLMFDTIDILGLIVLPCGSVLNTAGGLAVFLAYIHLTPGALFTQSIVKMSPDNYQLFPREKSTPIKNY